MPDISTASEPIWNLWIEDCLVQGQLHINVIYGEAAHDRNLAHP